jgi:hypothetical protein
VLETTADWDAADFSKVEKADYPHAFVMAAEKISVKKYDRPD